LINNKLLSYLRCPLCYSSFKLINKSLICQCGHCFDIAKKGYINFSQRRTERVYGNDLFKNRNKVFEMGLFTPVVNVLKQLISEYSFPDNSIMLDAGCGEGYYTRNISYPNCNKRIGLDLAKEGIVMASTKDKEGLYLVADLANIPIKDNSVGLILDVFTPANYKEFKRVLNTGGIVVKIIPKEEYLIELREIASGLLRKEEYDSSEVSHYTERNMDIIASKRITYSQSVSVNEAKIIASMTPMLAKVDTSLLDYSLMEKITIDEEIILGKVK